MAGNPWALLARLEKDELDRRRQALAAVEGRLGRLAEERAAVAGAGRSAVERPPAEAGHFGVWAGVVEGARRRCAELDQRLAEERRRAERAREAVREQLVTFKRYEILDARRQRDEERRKDRREQQALDDLAVMRHRPRR